VEGDQARPRSEQRPGSFGRSWAANVAQPGSGDVQNGYGRGVAPGTSCRYRSRCPSFIDDDELHITRCARASGAPLYPLCFRGMARRGQRAAGVGRWPARRVETSSLIVEIAATLEEVDHPTLVAEVRDTSQRGRLQTRRADRIAVRRFLPTRHATPPGVWRTVTGPPRPQIFRDLAGAPAARFCCHCCAERVRLPIHAVAPNADTSGAGEARTVSYASPRACMCRCSSMRLIRAFGIATVATVAVAAASAFPETRRLVATGLARRT
jgi:hypothetical protein